MKHMVMGGEGKGGEGEGGENWLMGDLIAGYVLVGGGSDNDSRRGREVMDGM